MINHLAVIPDGNRRWAKKNNLPLELAYRGGIEKVKEVAEWCRERGIKILSMWGFSLDNLKREREEIEILFRLFDEYLSKLLNEMKEENVRINIFGDLSVFPPSLREKMTEIMKKTEKNEKYILNLFLAYQGRREIVEAAKKACASGEISEEAIERNLYTAGLPDPDLLIRTGGEKRLSGFMPWQMIYTELYFTDILWPDFTKENFEEAMRWFETRERKFGR